MREYITIKWHREDIKAQARERDIALSDEDCSDVLDLLERRHDCNIGINWIVIECAIDEILEDKENV